MSNKRLPYDPARAARSDVASRTAHNTSRHLLKNLEFPPITSVSTEANYRSSVKIFADDLWTRFRVKLRNSDSSQANDWLEKRATMVRQKTLDQDRQALSNKFSKRLLFVKSWIPDVVNWRPYSSDQIDLLMDAASDELALSIAICTDAGLRSMEILTVGRLTDLSESPRDWPVDRFKGRENCQRFLVHGKGNLFREVRLSPYIAAQLELKRRPQPIKVRSREAEYISYFDLVGGQRLSQQFSRLSKSLLAWSSGVHGLRHSFAIDRYAELLILGFSTSTAVKILAGEMGHFSTKNTLGYIG